MTKGVLEYAKTPREKERQIAYTAATADVATRLAQVSAKQRVRLRLGGRITLVVAVRGAAEVALAWRSPSGALLPIDPAAAAGNRKLVSVEDVAASGDVAYYAG